MSLVDARAKFLLHLDEQADAVLPSDATGNLADPTIPAGVVLPAVASGTIGGYGRDFVRTAPSGLLYDDAADAIRLRRAVTVAAVFRIDLASLSNGNRCVLIQRGRGGAGDPIAFGLRLEVVNTTTGRVTARLFWETEAGATVEDVGVDFYPPSGEYTYLIAAREVVGTTFTCRYQVNSEQATGGTTAALDVGGITSADVSVGMGMSGASYVNHLDGVLDALQVLNEAMSHEEMAWGQRLALDMPDGVSAMRRMVPPGVYSTDPSSRIQRELANEGRVLGHAKSIARRRREYGLPDKAWGEVLSKWETLTGRPARAGDSIAERRTRVLDGTQNLRGFSLADLKLQLEESFDLASASIQILEYDNDLTEPFTSGTPSNRAKVVGGNGAWLSDAAAVAAGRQEYAASADDLRYAGRNTETSGLYLWSIGDMTDGWLHGRIERVTGDTDVVMGFALGSGTLDEWLFVGLGYKTGPGTQQISRSIYKNAALGAIVDLENPYATNPVYFRIHCQGGGTFLVKYGSSDANAKAHAGVQVTGGPSSTQWVGLAAVATAASVTATYRFDDVLIHAPRGHQRYHWYAYRDPGLGGGPNMPAARALVQRIKPAHTAAAAIQQQAVLCDDATRLTDREPIGA